MQRPKLLGREALKEYGVRALAARAHSQGEIRVKLARKAAEPADVDVVIQTLKDAGYLNDQQYAASYARSRLENQGLGKMRVLRDLRQRRIAPRLAEQTVTETFAGTEELELVAQYLERKYRGKPLGAMLKDPKNLASAYRRLRTAGFSSGSSITVLKRFAAEAEQLEGLEDGDPLADNRGGID